VKARKRTLCVTAGVVWRRGKVLATRRAPGQSRAGCWEFPGGTIRHGESGPRCLRRELREELGIDVAVGRRLMATLHEYADLKVRLLFYAARWTGGRLRLAVHDRVRWVAPRALKRLKFSAADLPMVKALGACSRRLLESR
jgi:8-oxo-dGTP diphosphatase